MACWEQKDAICRPHFASTDDSRLGHEVDCKSECLETPPPLPADQGYANPEVLLELAGWLSRDLHVPRLSPEHVVPRVPLGRATSGFDAALKHNLQGSYMTAEYATVQRFQPRCHA